MKKSFSGGERDPVQVRGGRPHAVHRDRLPKALLRLQLHRGGQERAHVNKPFVEFGSTVSESLRFVSRFAKGIRHNEEIRYNPYTQSVEVIPRTEVDADEKARRRSEEEAAGGSDGEEEKEAIY